MIGLTVLQEAWEASWAEDGSRNLLTQGLLEMWNSQPDMPLIVLNSTSLNDGCSINVSALDDAVSVGIARTPSRTLEGSDCVREP